MDAGMARPANQRTIGPKRLVALWALLPLLALAACGGGVDAGSSTLTVHVSDTANGWTFHDGQVVTVSMGPNNRFAPLSHVNIIQCSDPGGTAANLPTQFIDCDENTIQGDTVLVHANGSFSEPHYQLFVLPNNALGESKSNLPKCDQTHQCVLLVSEYQTDLTKPKVFSHPFTMLPANGTQGGS